MPRWVKVLIWIGVFGACAAAGAYVAAHTNPFPPGVEDPGARPTTRAPTSPTPTAQRWNLAMFSATRHDLHVGGACRSGWRTTGMVTIHSDGTITGEGRADVGGWSCDFTVAQVQTKIVRLVVTGSGSGNRLVLHFAEAGSLPAGSEDLGGFSATLTRLAPRLELVGRHANELVHVARPDGDLGRYVNDTKIQLGCATGCLMVRSRTTGIGLSNRG